MGHQLMLGCWPQFSSLEGAVQQRRLPRLDSARLPGRPLRRAGLRCWAVQSQARPGAGSRTMNDPVHLLDSEDPLYSASYNVASANRTAARAQGAAEGALVKVTTNYHVNFGDTIVLVGGHDSMGAWDPAGAMGMTWSEGDVWTAVAQLPAGKHEFKVVVKVADGSLLWEPGDNRSVEVPEAVPEGHLVTLDCAYGFTDQLEPVVAALDEGSLVVSEVAVAAADDAVAAVAKAMRTMDGEMEAKRRASDSESDSEALPLGPLLIPPSPEPQEAEAVVEEEPAAALNAMAAAAAAAAAADLEAKAEAEMVAEMEAVHAQVVSNQADAASDAEGTTATADVAAVWARATASDESDEEPEVAVVFRGKAPGASSSSSSTGSSANRGAGEKGSVIRAPAKAASDVVAAFMNKTRGGSPAPDKVVPAAATAPAAAAPVAEQEQVQEEEEEQGMDVAAEEEQEVEQVQLAADAGGDGEEEQEVEQVQVPLAAEADGKEDQVALAAADEEEEEEVALAADEGEEAQGEQQQVQVIAQVDEAERQLKALEEEEEPEQPQQQQQQGTGPEVVTYSFVREEDADADIGTLSAEEEAELVAAVLREGQEEAAAAALVATAAAAALADPSNWGAAALSRGGKGAAKKAEAAVAAAAAHLEAARAARSAAAAAALDASRALGPGALGYGSAEAFDTVSMGSYEEGPLAFAGGIGFDQQQVPASLALAAAAATSSMDGSMSEEDEVRSPDGAQLVGSLVGVAAVGTVLWSEFVLKETGCGLPPGPYGLLGAVEGLSYLGVLGLAGAGLARRVRGEGGLPGPLAIPEGLAYGAVAVGLVALAFQLKDHGYIPPALPGDKCYPEAAGTLPAGVDLSGPIVGLQSLLQPLRDALGTSAEQQEQLLQAQLLVQSARDQLASTMAEAQHLAQASAQALVVEGREVGAQLVGAVHQVEGQMDLPVKLATQVQLLQGLEVQLQAVLVQQQEALQGMMGSSLAATSSVLEGVSAQAQVPELLVSIRSASGTMHEALALSVQQLGGLLGQLQDSVNALAAEAGSAAAGGGSAAAEAASAQLVALSGGVSDALLSLQQELWASYQQLALADHLTSLVAATRVSAAQLAAAGGDSLEGLHLEAQLQGLEAQVASAVADLMAAAAQGLKQAQLDQRVALLQDGAAATADALAGSATAGADALAAATREFQEVLPGLLGQVQHVQEQLVLGVQSAGEGLKGSEGLLQVLQENMANTARMAQAVAGANLEGVKGLLGRM